jgi:nicotinamidase-related amidase
VNLFDFDGGDRLLRRALPAARRIAALKRRAARAGVPVVYVNDNYGDWHASFGELVRRCTRPDSPGRAFVERVRPRSEADYHILKPRHSGFHSTSLDVLLERLRVDTVVLAGVATHICVLFTAMDAYMRGLDVVVASDCVASEERRQAAFAIEQMSSVLKARVAPSSALRFGRRRRRSGAAAQQVEEDQHGDRHAEEPEHDPAHAARLAAARLVDRARLGASSHVLSYSQRSQQFLQSSVGPEPDRAVSEHADDHRGDLPLLVRDVDDGGNHVCQRDAARKAGLGRAQGLHRRSSCSSIQHGSCQAGRA